MDTTESITLTTSMKQLTIDGGKPRDNYAGRFRQRTKMRRWRLDANPGVNHPEYRDWLGARMFLGLNKSRDEFIAYIDAPCADVLGRLSISKWILNMPNITARPKRMEFMTTFTAIIFDYCRGTKPDSRNLALLSRLFDTTPEAMYNWSTEHHFINYDPLVMCVVHDWIATSEIFLSHRYRINEEVLIGLVDQAPRWVTLAVEQGLFATEEPRSLLFFLAMIRASMVHDTVYNLLHGWLVKQARLCDVDDQNRILCGIPSLCYRLDWSCEHLHEFVNTIDSFGWRDAPMRSRLQCMVGLMTAKIRPAIQHLVWRYIEMHQMAPPGFMEGFERLDGTPKACAIYISTWMDQHPEQACECAL